jgi:hypothetical protein
MDEGRIRKIIHIDMDAFYASVEQRDDPILKGKPVAVGYPAKRGVVAAASYEARRFGVRSAMPSTIATRKCSELVFVPPRFDVYREVSNQIHAIFKHYTPLVEPLSLDEAYLDVTDNLKGISTAWETAKEIRARIYDEIRLTASAGISCNKFLAKLASDYRKPNGQFAIMPDDAEAFVAILPVAKFHGVGPKTAAKMRAGSQRTVAAAEPRSVSAPSHAGLDRRRSRPPSQRTDVHVLGLHAEPLGARWRSASRPHSAEFRFDGASAKRRRRSSHTRTRGRQRPCARLGGASRRARSAVFCEPCRQPRDGRDAFAESQETGPPNGRGGQKPNPHGWP